MEPYAQEVCEPTIMALAERALKTSQRLTEAHNVLDNIETLLDGPVPPAPSVATNERKLTFNETMQANDDRSRVLVNRISSLAARLGA